MSQPEPSTDAQAITADAQAITAEVMALLVGVVDGRPCVLTVDGERLPSGPLLEGHRSLQSAVRAWAEAQTGLELGYLEQLYTFADRTSRRHLSVSYLGLTAGSAGNGTWVGWYDLFPWEDTRSGRAVATTVAPALAEWVESAPEEVRASLRTRVATLWGLDGCPWEPDAVLQRYECLFEAGLIPEAPDATRRDGVLVKGTPMVGDQRRIVATGLARLRAKIQYRPVVFELLPESFTLGQLQGCVEALAGRRVHTQNFRRLVEQQALVEETGSVASTGGRPARLYRFRRSVVVQRHIAGTRLPVVRSR